MNEQVSQGVLKIVLPLPNPPLIKGRGLDFPVSPLRKLRCTHKSYLRLNRRLETATTQAKPTSVG
jgi:hypothetical protein